MISNLNNGERFTTYAMAGNRGSGEVVLNGPTARKAVVGDKVIIFCYEFYAEDEAKRHQPKILWSTTRIISPITSPVIPRLRAKHPSHIPTSIHVFAQTDAP